MLSEHCKSFGRSSVALSVPHLSEKLGDAKLKKPAGDALTAFACKTSLQFVLNQGEWWSPILPTMAKMKHSVRPSIEAEGSKGYCGCYSLDRNSPDRIWDRRPVHAESY
jgi:hypothetical protein